MTAKIGYRLAGLVFLVICALLVRLAIAVYDKEFTTSAVVTVRADSTGGQLPVHADVKSSGVIVGEVAELRATGSTAELRLALWPEMLAQLPANVSAQLLPTSLFGQRYVNLVRPADAGSARLKAGDVIGQDRTSTGIKVQQVLDDLLPLLHAVKPEDLATTLSALSQALRGRGQQFGDTLRQLGSYLDKFNPHLSTVEANINSFADVAQTYSTAAPQLVDAVDDFLTTTRTIVEQRQQFGTFYSAVGSSSDLATEFLRNNSDTLIQLAAAGRPTLETFARYAPSYSCTLEALTRFIPDMDKALGKGTDRPGLRVTIKSVPDRGPYKFPADQPSYQPGPVKACPQGATAIGPQSAANSPAENQFVGELLKTQGASSTPDWSSVLVGPLYRGAEVTVR
ncbi:MCE family protein [Pseudonocardiaceae bacterium YIM PH 21723]|nr:MCE family protein [Pseudonocardiaceae bacterium YIM PH 21723]